MPLKLQHSEFLLSRQSSFLQAPLLVLSHLLLQGFFPFVCWVWLWTLTLILKLHFSLCVYTNRLLGRVALRCLSHVGTNELCHTKDGKPWPGFSQCYQGGNKVKTGSETGFGFATPAATGPGKRKGGCCFWKRSLCFSSKLHSDLLVAEPVNLPLHCTVAALPPCAESCCRWLPLPV